MRLLLGARDEVGLAAINQSSFCDIVQDGTSSAGQRSCRLSLDKGFRKQVHRDVKEEGLTCSFMGTSQAPTMRQSLGREKRELVSAYKSKFAFISLI